MAIALAGVIGVCLGLNAPQPDPRPTPVVSQSCDGDRLMIVVSYGQAMGVSTVENAVECRPST